MVRYYVLLHWKEYSGLAKAGHGVSQPSLVLHCRLVPVWNDIVYNLLQLKIV